MIVANLVQNAKTAQEIITRTVAALPFERTCECANALRYAIITRPEMIPDRMKTDLAPIVGKYLAGVSG
jgi:5'-methylthioadenosine phosphorylase